MDEVTGKLGSLQLSKSLDGVARRLMGDIARALEELRQTPETDPRHEELRQEINQNIEDVAMLASASAEEVKKYLDSKAGNSSSSNSGSSSKRPPQNDDNAGGEKKKRFKD
jgi:DNA-directed RNA polymerase specialized sigma subunit